MALSAIAAIPLACGEPPSRDGVASEADAITRSSIDANPLDAAVVALVRNDRVACTGTLIAPFVVLTAAHCIGDERSFDVFFGTRYEPGAVSVHAHFARVHPRYRRASLNDDIALLVLERSAPPEIVPVPALRPGLLDDGWIGRSLRIVGFGDSGVADAAVGEKREGTARIVDSSNLTLALQPSPSLTCDGDSGGPAFVSALGVEYVAGVTSSGDTACRENGVDVRVDAYYEEFLAPQLRRLSAGSVDVGGACAFDEQCGGGLCVSGEDDPSAYYCTIRCAEGGSCPDAMKCAGHVCRLTGPSPGAIGAPCKADDDCARQLCVGADEGSPGTCSVPCWPGARTCPANAGTCVAHTHATGEFACDGQPRSGDTLFVGGGCALTARSDQDVSLGVLAAALLSFRRSRRRVAVD